MQNLQPMFVLPCVPIGSGIYVPEVVKVYHYDVETEWPADAVRTEVRALK